MAWLDALESRSAAHWRCFFSFWPHVSASFPGLAVAGSPGIAAGSRTDVTEEESQSFTRSHPVEETGRGRPIWTVRESSALVRLRSMDPDLVIWTRSASSERFSAHYSWSVGFLVQTWYVGVRRGGRTRGCALPEDHKRLASEPRGNGDGGTGVVGTAGSDILPSDRSSIDAFSSGSVSCSPFCVSLNGSGR